MIPTRHLIALLMGALALVIGSAVSAKTRTGVVYADGRVVMTSSAKAKLDCTGDPDDLFSFQETASPDRLTLSENERETGNIQVTVEILDSCDSGQATFDYLHDDFSRELIANPSSFSITVAIPGGTDSQTISYQALDDNETEDTQSFSLQRDQIVFNVGDVFGQASTPRELAHITVPANTDDVADVGDLPDNAPSREVDAIRALNRACQAARQGNGSTDGFLDACNAIASQDLTQSETSQVARAVDPHELSSQPQAAAETGQIQQTNLQSRLAALRGGATGVSLSGLTLAMNGNAFQTTWLQAALAAQGDDQSAEGTQLLGQRWGVFVNGSITVGDRDERNKELGFDFDAYGITAGVDYRFDNGLILGSAMGFTKNEADLDQDGGELETHSISLQGFTTFNFTDNLYLDMTLAYSEADFDQARIVDLSAIPGLSRAVANGSTDAQQFSGSLSLNYSQAFENGLTTMYYGQAYYADTDIDPFTENGSAFPLSYPVQEFDSLFWSVGARFAKAFSLENSVFTPFLDINFGQQTQFDGYFLQPIFAESGQTGPLIEISEPDQEYGEASVGGSWVFRNGNQIFIRLNSLFANSDTDRYNLSAGARFEF